MNGSVSSSIAVVLSCLLLSLPSGAAAQEVDSTLDLEATARNQTIIWFEGKTSPQIKSTLTQFANGRTFANIDRAPDFELGVLSGVVLPVGAAESFKMLAELEVRTRSKDEQDANVARETIAAISSIEPDGLVEMFDGECEADDATPIDTEEDAKKKQNSDYEGNLPDWYKYINAPIVPKSGSSFKRSVWIVDSGISSTYDGDELVVERGSANSRSANCVGKGAGDCAPDVGPKVTTEDKLGHGTVIAGIIGAKENSKWFKGIAPGVNLVAVKVFKGNKTNWVTIYKGLKHIASNAKTGDVVNLSFGGQWSFVPPSEGPKKSRRKIEEFLQKMVQDKGLRIAIAAGNIGEYGVVDSSGYVQTITPARAGGYRAAGGMVMTVTAAGDGDSDGANGSFSPKFWEYSAFGNPCGAGGNCTEGPPDFAEPGVNIESLWPRSEKNICTGTSFAAAVLSGLLVQGTDIQKKGQVADDPSGTNPAGSDANDDWIGSCLMTDGVCTEVAP